jgi:hypothetical protein
VRGGRDEPPPKMGVEKIETWIDADGSLQLLKRKEQKVLDLLKEVRDDEEWKEIPSLRAWSGRNEVKGETGFCCC